MPVGTYVCRGVLSMPAMESPPIVSCDMASNALKVIIEKITIDLVRHYPRAVILFGSAARYICGIEEEAPEEIDVLYVGRIKPMHTDVYRIPCDLFFFEEHEILSIAKSLRYSPKSMARAKMFFKVTLKFAADMAQTTRWRHLLQCNDESRKLSWYVM